MSLDTTLDYLDKFNDVVGKVGKVHEKVSGKPSKLTRFANNSKLASDVTRGTFTGKGEADWQKKLELAGKAVKEAKRVKKKRKPKPAKKGSSARSKDGGGDIKNLRKPGKFSGRRGNR